tara:strand:- start:2023 stop:4254 length:2232 start_codon:yes stop_codon:yes gene_type:complete
MKLYFFILISFIFSLSERYHTFYEVEDQLFEWDEEFGSNESPWPAQYPGSGIIYSLHQIGVSENDQLPIYAVKLSYNANQDEDEARVLILGQCHAEEIYGVEIAMELIDWLLHPNANYPVSYLDRVLAISNAEIWVVPTHNPEGLLTVHGDAIEGEWVQDEWYRKNKSDINSNQVFDYIYGPGNDSDGVDLNRNYDFNWIFGDDEYELDYGCSANPSYISNFDYYRGKHPFSESEIQAIRDFAIEKQFLLSIAYHSSRSGCVSEKVIYPWQWAEGKESPDFEVVDKLGRDIAALIPTEDGITTYLPSGSISRRGNAHDWFYSQTGCIQYLIEAGTSNIQADDEQIIEDTIDRNLIGAFHLINRASGNSVGSIGADKYQINGIVTDYNSSETLNAEVRILEMDGPMLKARMTDEFGRYRRLLYPGTFTLEVSSEGYETYVEQNIVPSASSFVERDIQLNPLDQHEITFIFNYPEDYNQEESLKLVYSNKWGDTEVGVVSGDTISLFEGDYDIKITDYGSNFIMPIKDNINVINDTELVYSLDWSKVLYNGINSNDWIIESGDWIIDTDIKTQESLFYSNEYNAILKLDSILFSNNSIAALVDLRYELEWEKDFFDLAFMVDNGNFYESLQLSGHDFDVSNKFILLSNGDGYVNFQLLLNSDSSLNYRGVIVDGIKILTNSLDGCEYGDVDHNGIINVSDVIMVVNYVLDSNVISGYYKCSSDINNDDGINILDIIGLVDIILGD